MKVIIVGAGIGGLTTAIALQQVGITNEIYERTAQITKVGAGLTLWQNALTVFDVLGLGDTLRAHGAAKMSAAIRDWRGKVLVGADSPYEMTVIHRAELQDMLLEAYDGSVHLNSPAIGYKTSENTARLRLEDGSSVEADLVIACDGIHSPIRQQMHPNSAPYYAGYTAWRGVLDFPHADVANMWGETWGKRQRFGITPLSNERVYWFATTNTPAEQKNTADENKTILLKRFANWHNPIANLLQATDAEAILHNDIYQIAPLAHWEDKCIVLSGDAAHAMTPNMGQGACQAIEDSYVLAQCLKRERNIDAALQNYQRIRRPRANMVMQQSERIGQVGQLDNPAAVWFRDTVARLTPSSLMQGNLNKIVGYDVRTALKDGL